MITINEIIETPELIDSLDDKEIKQLSYGIKYFDVYSAYTDNGREIPAGAEETLNRLKVRLKAIEQPNRIHKVDECV